mmetsp:Transcript_22586/g.68883  ORF Transcript_22586/g.68883 Transcript_22586/m.68883 type:complete len:114 (+) Transcript_22586:217-558(+)|eukprot:scaffold227090_cov34-Tisochrysis_lutea.AAC.2
MPKPSKREASVIPRAESAFSPTMMLLSHDRLSSMLVGRPNGQRFVRIVSLDARLPSLALLNSVTFFQRGNDVRKCNQRSSMIEMIPGKGLPSFSNVGHLLRVRVRPIETIDEI